MPRTNQVGWVILIAVLLIAANLIPSGDNPGPNLKIQMITASAALMQVDGLLRNISQINSGCSEWLVRANSALFSRGFWMTRRPAQIWGGAWDMPFKLKKAPHCAFVAVMVIGLFFAFFQSSRNMSGLDDASSGAAIGRRHWALPSGAAIGRRARPRNGRTAPSAL